MKPLKVVTVGRWFFLLLSLLSVFLEGRGVVAKEVEEAQVEYGKLALGFEPNVGQLPEEFDSIARGPGYAVYLSEVEMQIALRPTVKGHAGRGAERTKTKRERGEGVEGTTTLLRFKLLEANAKAGQHFGQKLAGTINYLRGSDPAGWHQEVPTYSRLKYESVYPGVDLVYHGNQRQLEHDFVVAGGADPKVIRWEVGGAERIEKTAEGSLLLHTAGGVLRMPKAYAYQDLPTGHTAVAVEYELHGTNTIGFVLGAYDTSATLVIDPVLYYSTFLGGGAYDEAYGISVDSAGNAYVTGVSFSTNFPVVNARQGVKAADGDAFVAKINPAGSALLFCTYLGGNGYDEGAAVRVDGAGAVYVAGVTFSTNFPTANANVATNSGKGDAFLTKLSASGASLVYSTYYGSSGYDEAAALAVSSGGIACIAGTTEQPSVSDMDGFVTKYSANGLVQTYSVLISGSGSDAVYGIALDSSLNAYVVGQTESSDFPVTSSAFDRTYGGAGDGFVAKLNAAGTLYLYSSYLGGSRTDAAYALALDGNANAYVTGETYSSNFPLVTPFQSALKTGGDGFLTKINAAGSALVYSTYFGGSNLDYGSGVAVDSTGSAHLTGYTASADFPKSFAFQTKIGGASDAFVARFNAAGRALIYSTFLGGSNIDYANAIAVDSACVAYVAGYTVSGNYPLYLPLKNKFSGVADAFVTKIGNPVVTIRATDATAGEPSNPGTCTITRTGNPVLPLVVYFTVSGTASPGGDCMTINSPVTIPAGSTSKTITITPIDDLAWEGNETVILTLSPNANYTVGPNSTATVTTVDNELKPTVTIQATDPNASEQGGNTGRFTVTRTSSTAGPLTVFFTVSGTATKGTDYVNVGTSVTIPAGSTTAIISITPINEASSDGNETVILTLSPNSLYNIGGASTGTVTITETSSVSQTVTVAATDATATEAGPTTGQFTFTRVGSTASSLTVKFAITGTATLSSDYSVAGSLSSIVIPAGSATATLTVTPIDDLIIETNETSILTLVADSAYTIGTSNKATVTITNDDTVKPVVTVVASDATATEAGLTTGKYTFTRTGGSLNVALTVHYTMSGSATNFTDYSGCNGSVIIPAQSNSVTLTLTPLDDLAVEGNETAVLTLSTDSIYTVGSPASATITLSDNDGGTTVTVVATDTSASEPGTNTGAFTFTRTGSTAVALTVNYVVTGTATQFSDYSGLNNSVTIPAGSASVVATLTPTDDLSIEGNETATVTLSPDALYNIGAANTGTVTITDNDSAKPTVTVAATDASASESGANPGTFVFSRSGGDSSVALSVTYAVTGTATQFSDYSGVFGTVTIPAGSNSQTVNLTVYDDLIIESSETAIVTISTDPNSLYLVGSPNSATITIADDDTVKPSVSVVVSDSAASEAGTNPATFTFTRTGGSTNVALGVTFAVGGTATQFTDYTGVFGSVTIPQGSSSAVVTLSVYDDLIIEPSETVVVTISADPNNLYTVAAQNTATATIASDDTVKPVVTVVASDSTAAEPGATINEGTFTFTRTGGNTNVALSVAYAVGGTATQFSDYSGVFGSVTIPVGSSSATVTVSPYSDSTSEPTETVIVTVSADSNNIYTVGGSSSATVNLLNTP